MNEKKVREAIEELKAEIRNYNSMIEENKDFSALCVRLKIKIERYTTAIKALEKQLPKKPIEHSANLRRFTNAHHAEMWMCMDRENVIIADRN